MRFTIADRLTGPISASPDKEKGILPGSALVAEIRQAEKAAYKGVLEGSTLEEELVKLFQRATRQRLDGAAKVAFDALGRCRSGADPVQAEVARAFDKSDKRQRAKAARRERQEVQKEALLGQYCSLVGQDSDKSGWMIKFSMSEMRKMVGSARKAASTSNSIHKAKAKQADAKAKADKRNRKQ